MIGPSYLSVSQVNSLKTCPRQYVFKHILKEREFKNKNLLVGTAFHKMLEGKDVEAELKELPAEYPHRAVLKKMKRVYEDATAQLPKVIAREVNFRVDSGQFEIMGYVDAVRVGDDGWYLGEEKTAAVIDENKKNMLAFDLQICTYMYSQAAIARQVGVDKPFKGLIYTATTKPSEKVKKTETLEEFAARATVETRVWKVEDTPPERIKLIVETEFNWAQKTKQEIEATWISSGENLDAIPSNSHSCFKFNTPCNYFEKCYGTKPVVKGPSE